MPESTSAVLRPARGRLAGRRSRRPRKYLAAFRVSLMAQLAYPGEVLMRSVFLLLILFIFASLWRTTYGEMGRRTIGGFSFTQMLWYVALTEALILSRGRTSITIADEVRSGDFAYALTRPFNFVLYRYAEAMGDRVVRLSINFGIASALALLFTGGVGLDPVGAAPALLLAWAAVSLDFLFVLAVQMLAFWTEDTTAFQFIYDRLLMILGGMLLPIRLFPHALALLARALPFAAIINGPAQTAVAFDAGALPGAVLRLGLWLAAGLVLASLLFRAGVRRVNANGG